METRKFQVITTRLSILVIILHLLDFLEGLDTGLMLLDFNSLSFQDFLFVCGNLKNFLSLFLIYFLVVLTLNLKLTLDSSRKVTFNITTDDLYSVEVETSPNQQQTITSKLYLNDFPNIIKYELKENGYLRQEPNLLFFLSLTRLLLQLRSTLFLVF